MTKTIRSLLIILIITTITIGGLALFCNNFNNTPLKDIGFSHLKMNCLGDSITYGYDGARGGAQLPNPYPKLLQNELGLKQVRNYGISGSTLTSVHPDRDPMCIRYAYMNNDADIISVMGGFNDYWLNIELGTIEDENTTTIYGALNTLAKGLKNKYPNAYIFFMTPYIWGLDSGTNDIGYSLLYIANAIKQVCYINNIDGLDMYTLGQFELDFVNYNCDKLHPTQWFLDNYTAPQIAQFIIDNYNKDNEIIE